MLSLLSASADTITGCLVGNADEIYTNYIGKRDPYWAANTKPSTDAYNGKKIYVDNRNVSDVTCGTYYIVSTTKTNCVQYTNDSTPVFAGGNGVLATVSTKVCNVPMDDYVWILALGAGVTSAFFLSKRNFTI